MVTTLTEDGFASYVTTCSTGSQAIPGSTMWAIYDKMRGAIAFVIGVAILIAVYYLLDFVLSSESMRIDGI